MSDADAQYGEDPPSEGAGGEQDPLVARRRPDPAKPPEPVLELVGFRGDSDREGYRRLYFTPDLDYYADFRIEDVVDVKEIPTDQHPFLGEQCSRVSIRRDARVEYTRTQTPRSVDEFDLDIRLGSRRASADAYGPQTAYAATGDCYTCATECPTACPNACVTRIGVSCAFACLPYTVEDPTCTPTCQGPSCDTGCCRLPDPYASQIDTACVPPCWNFRR